VFFDPLVLCQWRIDHEVSENGSFDFGRCGWIVAGDFSGLPSSLPQVL
jgi:hypothetical protein